MEKNQNSTILQQPTQVGIGIGFRVVSLHDWSSNEGDGVGIPDGGLGTVVEFVENCSGTM